jgi:hypothetical protein
MNRRNFFASIAGALAAPSLVPDLAKKEPVIVHTWGRAPAYRTMDVGDLLVSNFVVPERFVAPQGQASIRLMTGMDRAYGKEF